VLNSYLYKNINLNFKLLLNSVINIILYIIIINILELLLSSAILNIEDKVIYYNINPLEILYKASLTYKEA
jgi:hypothetical protein